jgi:hypothetical protein
MNDPMLSLALSMHANPGVYALLLGSGVSRSAGIPTGWEVVLDLIRRLATLEGEDCEPEPDAWYREKYGTQPTYSGLLDAVAKAPAERSQLLKAYFQPTDDEREQNLKVPTAAHRAIARLVKKGAVKVVLTTNFDRLVEQALQAEGVSPTVISTPDAADGALPIVHSPATVIKLHGDYLDTRIKNTPDELARYDGRIDELLDRVLDEFGLVVCGWSAEWDTALCSAIERCKGRRFTTYWAHRGKVPEAARKLVDLRGAVPVGIKGADEFFSDLAEKVDALADVDRPHPASAKIAVAQVKRYIVDPKYHIQLHDLLMSEVERIRAETAPERNPVSGSFKDEDFANRIRAFDALSEIIMAEMATGCYWGTEHHVEIWCKAIERLANPSQPQQCNTAMQGLRSYPSLLALYAGGIASVAAERELTLFEMFGRPKVLEQGEKSPLLIGLCERIRLDAFKTLPDMSDKKTPLSMHLSTVLRGTFWQLIPDDKEYERAFDRHEVIQAVVAASQTGRPMPGNFMWRYGHSPLNALKAEIVEAGKEWPPLAMGFFGGVPDKALEAVRHTVEVAERVGW